MLHVPCVMAKRMRDIHVQSLFRFLRKTTKGVSKRDSSEMTLRRNDQRDMVS